MTPTKTPIDIVAGIAAALGGISGVIRALRSRERIRSDVDDQLAVLQSELDRRTAELKACIDRPDLK